jgi:glutamine synthetase
MTSAPEVVRYDKRDFDHSIEVYPDGQFVLAYDYDAMRRHRDTLAARVAELEGERDFWREHFAELQAARYRDAGMKIEQARIHAETDVRQLEITLNTSAARGAKEGCDA